MVFTPPAYEPPKECDELRDSQGVGADRLGSYLGGDDIPTRSVRWTNHLAMLFDVLHEKPSDSSSGIPTNGTAPICRATLVSETKHSIGIARE